MAGPMALAPLPKPPCPHNMNNQSEPPDNILHPAKAIERHDSNMCITDFAAKCSLPVQCWSMEWLLPPELLVTPHCYYYTTTHNKCSKKTHNPTGATQHLDNHL